MSKTIQLTTLFFLCSLLLGCNKYLGDPTNSSSYDSDAQRFIDSAGITDLKQKSVLNNFIKQLKDSSLWTKFQAIYPMIGGTASTTKLNLKSPENTDAAYRLTFYGNPVYAATGVLFPTLADYADTHLPDNALGGYTNASIAYYSRTQNTISGYDIGCTDGARPFNELSIYCKEGDDTEWFGFNMDTLPANTTGLFILSSSSTNVSLYRNGVIVKSKG